MQTVLARQPIFDTKMRVVAYELLYRTVEVGSEHFDGDRATSSVLVNGVALIGLKTLTEDKRAFVNFTRNLLVGDHALALSPSDVTVEVLEDIAPDEALIAALHRLKDAGFTIALDDYVSSYPHQEIVDLADIIKVDLLAESAEGMGQIAERFRGSGKLLLAEKVETKAQFHEAAARGYTLFQGYFFARPELVSTHDVGTIAISYVRLLAELSAEDPDFRRITQVIEHDLALSYKLLRIVNSAACRTSRRITSIHQALTLLGLTEIRKWIALIMLRDAGKNKPDELIRISLVRAKFMEGVAELLGGKTRKSEFFLTGILSLLDTIMDKPFEILLDEVPVGADIGDALKGNPGTLRKALDIVIAYERGHWQSLADIEGIEANRGIADLSVRYYEALAWAREMSETG
ncbi:MAG: HDOD domain-containing protein [Candidatus Nanopelagicales bacterium]